MTEQFQSSEPSQSTNNLSELKKQINLSSALLVQIVSSDDRFTEKLKFLNDAGVQAIHNEEYSVALIYLQEAEKVLQYAASCGKTIDRWMIISTLQNQACIYQRLWETDKASNYLEAIIFNMNTYMECAPGMNIDSQIFDTTSPSYHSLSVFIRKRLNLAFFYLQSSAISSQLKKHESALNCAFSALSMLKLICQECYSYQKYIRKDEKYQQGTRIILKELSCLKETVEVQKMSKYITLAKRGISNIKGKLTQDQFIEKLSVLSIGQIMQVSPISMEELQNQPKIREQVTYIQKLYKAIYISICFFTIGTEMRLIASQNYVESQVQESPQFKKSKVYHLNAIIIATKYVPYETRYLDHILKSFLTHYGIDLFGQKPHNHAISQETVEDLTQSMGNALFTQNNPSGLSISSRKVQQEYETNDIESPCLKNNRYDLISTKLHTQHTFSSDKSLEYTHNSPSYELRKKKKNHSKQKNENKKEKYANANKGNSNQLLGNKGGECFKELFGGNFVHSSHNLHNFKSNERKSSLYKKINNDKVKMIMPSRNRHKNQTKQKNLKDKQKSRQKSKSNSKNHLSFDKKQKQKSTEKAKKKNNKLSEQYFIKPTSKKRFSNKLKTTLSSKSVKKHKNIDDYLSSQKNMQIINNGTTGNSVIGYKKSPIKGTTKIKF